MTGPHPSRTRREAGAFGLVGRDCRGSRPEAHEHRLLLSELSSRLVAFVQHDEIGGCFSTWRRCRAKEKRERLSLRRQPLLLYWGLAPPQALAESWASRQPRPAPKVYPLGSFLLHPHAFLASLRGH